MPLAVFADTFYWLAMARPRDKWHAAVVRWAAANAAARIVTTDEVLTEFLNALSGTGPAGPTPRRRFTTSATTPTLSSYPRPAPTSTPPWLCTSRGPTRATA